MKQAYGLFFAAVASALICSVNVNAKDFSTPGTQTELNLTLARWEANLERLVDLIIARRWLMSQDPRILTSQHFEASDLHVEFTQDIVNVAFSLATERVDAGLIGMEEAYEVLVEIVNDPLNVSHYERLMEPQVVDGKGSSLNQNVILMEGTSKPLVDTQNESFR